MRQNPPVRSANGRQSLAWPRTRQPQGDAPWRRSRRPSCFGSKTSASTGTVAVFPGAMIRVRSRQLRSARAELDVLGVLVARAGEVVSKDEIIAAVWPGTVVEDSNLTVQISALRRVIDQGRSDGSYIQTVSGRGYRFVAPVTHSVEGVRAATSISQPLFAPRLSIVVLPFANLSDDREQQYFSDGLTEDLTTDLSRISGSLVIARNTAFTYKGKAIDVKQIGRELGVRYVLEGSVRRSGDRVRVNAQLVDAETGVHLWAERFNRTASDLLEIQDDITLCIASELKAELVEAESKRAIREHPNNLDAIDLTMQARALSNKPSSPEQNAQVRQLYEKALSINLENVDALIGLANGL